MTNMQNVGVNRLVFLMMSIHDCSWLDLLDQTDHTVE